MKTLVFNGWAAGPETWALCDFPRDWTFDYIEQLDGLPEKVVDESDDLLLVGFSMGGSTALRMLLRAPGKVRGLVLVSATPCMKRREGWCGMSDRRLDALRLGTALAFRNDPSPIYARENMERGLAYLDGTDLRADLRALGPTPFPVVVFQSERDGIVRPENAAFLKSVFPQAEVVMVPGAEHVLPVTVPERISAAVRRIGSEVLPFHNEI